MAEAKRTNSSASSSSDNMGVPQEIIELRKLKYYNAVLIALRFPLKDNWKKHRIMVNHDDKNEDFLISKENYSL